MTTSTPRPAPGTQVSVVFYEGTAPKSFSGRIESLFPLCVSTENPLCRDIEPGRRALLAYQDGDRCFKAEFELSSLETTDQGWKILGEKAEWDAVDRRRYPRFLVQIPAELRAVSEREGEVTLSTFDALSGNVSLGGASFSSSKIVEAGALVNVVLLLSDLDRARVLGMAAWSNEDGQFGIEFLDFIGDARHKLHLFLTALEA